MFVLNKSLKRGAARILFNHFGLGHGNHWAPDLTAGEQFPAYLLVSRREEREGRKEGRNAGRQEGRKAGKEEGRQAGMKGREEGKKGGREGGRKEREQGTLKVVHPPPLYKIRE